MKPWLALLLALPVQAADVAGVNFPESRDVVGKTLVLNGAGVREYGMFGIDVYAAALYLPFDGYALLRHPGWPALIVFTLNLLVVWVLARDLAKRRR